MTRSAAAGVGTPVVLLHGLGRTASSLARLARVLEAHGHPTLSLDYPSRRYDVRACAERLLPAIVGFQQRSRREIAFVGHSMGGLVARVLAADPTIPVASLIMLAPPNRGSEVADFVHRFRLGRYLLGPALADLRTAMSANLPVPACPIGIIAGTRSYLPFTGILLSEPHDGLVSLERARLDEAVDWIAVEASHTLIMNHRAATTAVLIFLAHQRFKAP